MTINTLNQNSSNLNTPEVDIKDFTLPKNQEKLDNDPWTWETVKEFYDEDKKILNIKGDIFENDEELLEIIKVCEDNGKEISLLDIRWGVNDRWDELVYPITELPDLSNTRITGISLYQTGITNISQEILPHKISYLFIEDHDYFWEQPDLSNTNITELYIRHTNISKIEIDILPPNLQVFDISWNENIDKLPNLSDFGLTDLLLSWLKIEEINPDYLPNSLQILNLYWCKSIIELPDLSQKSIISLNLSETKILNIDEEKLPHKLINLDISWNKNIDKLPNLSQTDIIELILTNTNITNINKNLLPKNLKILDITSCKNIKNLPNLFDTKITELKLFWTGISEIKGLPNTLKVLKYPYGYTILPNIENTQIIQLDLEFTRISKIGKLPNTLQEIFFPSYRENNEDIDFSNTQITKLNLKDTFITQINNLPDNLQEITLPTVINQQPNLSNTQITELDFNKTKITEINPDFFPQTLQVLDLGDIELLNTIDLSETNITELIFMGDFSKISSLPEKLEILNLNFNFNLTKLPNIYNTKIKKLHLNTCSNLTEIKNENIPKWLELLDIKWCRLLKEIPNLSLTNLTELYIPTNIKILPSLPESLEILDLKYNNKIKHLPQKLPNIKKLYLSFTSIKKLPPLPNSLEILDINVNHEIKELPQLSHTKLRKLDISCTNIDILPKLPNTLKEIYLSSTCSIHYETIKQFENNPKIFNKLITNTIRYINGWHDWHGDEINNNKRMDRVSEFPSKYLYLMIANAHIDASMITSSFRMIFWAEENQNKKKYSLMFNKDFITEHGQWEIPGMINGYNFLKITDPDWNHRNNFLLNLSKRWRLEIFFSTMTLEQQQELIDNIFANFQNIPEKDQQLTLVNIYNMTENMQSNTNNNFLTAYRFTPAFTLPNDPDWKKSKKAEFKFYKKFLKNIWEYKFSMSKKEILEIWQEKYKDTESHKKLLDKQRNNIITSFNDKFYEIYTNKETPDKTKQYTITISGLLEQKNPTKMNEYLNKNLTSFIANKFPDIEEDFMFPYDNTIEKFKNNQDDFEQFESEMESLLETTKVELPNNFRQEVFDKLKLDYQTKNFLTKCKEIVPDDYDLENISKTDLFDKNGHHGHIHMTYSEKNPFDGTAYSTIVSKHRQDGYIENKETWYKTFDVYQKIINPETKNQKILTAIIWKPLKKLPKDKNEQDVINDILKYTKENKISIQALTGADHSFYQHHTLDILKKLNENWQEIAFVNYRSCGGNGLVLKSLQYMQNPFVMSTSGIWTAWINNNFLVVRLDQIDNLADGKNIDINFQELKIGQAKNYPRWKFKDRFEDYVFPHENQVSIIDFLSKDVDLDKFHY